MALEASCWVPLMKAQRLCLAGDHCQLPPTVKSDAALAAGLGRTLFERLLAAHEAPSGQGAGAISRLLAVQYRMHATISNWASQHMYGGRLRSAAAVADRTLADLPHAEAIDLEASDHAEGDDEEEDAAAEMLKKDLMGPLVLIDTAGWATRLLSIGTPLVLHAETSFPVR
jgi:superfamily I DNA and/or RNA helicase